MNFIKVKKIEWKVEATGLKERTFEFFYDTRFGSVCQIWQIQILVLTHCFHIL